MFILYETTNLLNNKIYIGVHEQKKDDCYLGSGIAICRAIKKYGKENFSRKTLLTFDNANLAFAAEAEIVNKDFMKRSDVYNMRLGGRGGLGHNWTVEQKKNHSLIMLNLYENGLEPWNKNKTGVYTAEHIKNMSNRTRIQMIGNQYAKGMTYKHSEEAKKNIGNFHRGKVASKELKEKISKNRKGLGVGSANGMALQENRDKVSESKIGRKKMTHKTLPNRLILPGSEAEKELMSLGYKYKMVG